MAQSVKKLDFRKLVNETRWLVEDRMEKLCNLINSIELPESRPDIFPSNSDDSYYEGFDNGYNSLAEEIRKILQ